MIPFIWNIQAGKSSWVLLKELNSWTKKVTLFTRRRPHLSRVLLSIPSQELRSCMSLQCSFKLSPLTQTSAQRYRKGSSSNHSPSQNGLDEPTCGCPSPSKRTHLTQIVPQWTPLLLLQFQCVHPQRPFYGLKGHWKRTIKGQEVLS